MVMPLRVAIVGMGNCAAGLLQGWGYYRNSAEYPGGLAGLEELPPVGRIEFVAGFDVDARKVGRDLADAIHTPPNNCPRFFALPAVGVRVSAGPLGDGIGPGASSHVPEITVADVDEVADVLISTDAQLVVNLLPTGSTAATAAYAQAALNAGCGFINCSSVDLARDETWRDRFAQRSLPLIGDDLKAQLGATIVHRTLTKLFDSQGIVLDRTYQINAAGNMNFVNLSDERRSADKAVTKANGISRAANGGRGLPADDLYVGMADYIPLLGDRKIAYIRMEGHTFGALPVDIELRMNVPDSGNATGAILDAIRLAGLTLDVKDPGLDDAVAAVLMKEPPIFIAKQDAESALQSAIRSAGEQAGRPHDGSS